MPRKRDGFVSRRIELPVEMDAAIVMDAERRGESVYTWIGRAVAKRLGMKYVEPKRGRPPKEVTPE